MLCNYFFVSRYLIGLLWTYWLIIDETMIWAYKWPSCMSIVQSIMSNIRGYIYLILMILLFRLYYTDTVYISLFSCSRLVETCFTAIEQCAIHLKPNLIIAVLLCFVWWEVLHVKFHNLIASLFSSQIARLVFVVLPNVSSFV